MPPDPEIAVRCRGVTKTYGTGEARETALRGVDLDVLQGEMLMLVGPSGCGKTTLVSIVTGILDRDGGSCDVFGTDMQQLPAPQRTRLRGQSIGFVFQSFNLMPSLTAMENVTSCTIVSVSCDGSQPSVKAPNDG